MRHAAALALAIALAVAAPLRADERASALSQLDAAIDAVRTGAAGDSRLSDVERKRGELQKLASELADGESQLESKRFRASFLKEEWESAKRQRDWLEKLYDAKTQQLKEEGEGLQRATDAHNATSNVEREEADLAAYNAEAEEGNRRNQDFNRRLEEHITVDGKALLEATAGVSKKEREYVEAQNAYVKLDGEVTQRAGTFASGMAAALALASELAEALREAQAPPPATTTFTTRASEGDAEARPVAPPGSGGAASETYLIGAAARDPLRARVRTERAKETLAKYSTAPAPAPEPAPAASAPKPIDSTNLVRGGGLALPPASGPAPGGAAGGPEALDLEAMIDPRSFVTREMYEQAKRELARMGGLEEKYEAKLIELRKWKNDTQRYAQEFEALRAEAARGALSDALSLVPCGEIAEGMLQSAKYAKYMTPEIVSAIKAAQNELKILSAMRDAAQSKEDIDRVKARLSTLDNAASQFVDLKSWGLPDTDPGRKYVEQLGRQFRTYVKVAAFAYEQHGDPQKKDWDRVIDASQVAAEVTAIYFPPLEVGLAAYSLAQREFKDRQAQRALRDLGGALASNWKAEGHLRRKIEELHEFEEEDRRTVRSWEDLPASRRGGHEIR